MVTFIIDLEVMPIPTGFPHALEKRVAYLVRVEIQTVYVELITRSPPNTLIWTTTALKVRHQWLFILVVRTCTRIYVSKCYILLWCTKDQNQRRSQNIIFRIEDVLAYVHICKLFYATGNVHWAMQNYICNNINWFSYLFFSFRSEDQMPANISKIKPTNNVILRDTTVGNTEDKFSLDDTQYIILASRNHAMCSTTTQTFLGQMAFLYNQGYPDYIPSGDTDCDCSVEVDDCDAKIQIYTLHMALNIT